MLHIRQRNLPHWHQDGSIYFVTFRLVDSLPSSVLHAWAEDRKLWLKAHPKPWDDQKWEIYESRFGRRLDDWLDAGQGECFLGREKLREIVRDCLMRFDGSRLNIHAAVIMPNHVHALIEPKNSQNLSILLKGIKGASSRLMNQISGLSRSVWQEESYDHIVRSEGEYGHYLRYIQENPVKAGLSADRYWLQSR